MIQVSPHVAFEQPGQEFKNLTRDEIKPFMAKNHFSEFFLSNKFHFEFSCEEVKIRKRNLPKGMFLPKCLINKLKRLLLFSTQVFNENKFEYELDAGSVVGQVKLSSTLPWERDHDLNYRSRHLKPLQNMTSNFLKKDYHFQPSFKGLKKCLKNKDWQCAYMAIRSKDWKVELWGQNVLVGDSYRLGEEIIDKRLIKMRVVGNITLGQIDDSWIATQNNPGLYCRSKYGLNVLKHQQHWSDLGKKSSWIPYKPGKWKKCKTPGHNACADNFLADGNIIFKNIWI